MGTELQVPVPGNRNGGEGIDDMKGEAGDDTPDGGDEGSGAALIQVESSRHEDRVAAAGDIVAKAKAKVYEILKEDQPGTAAQITKSGAITSALNRCPLSARRARSSEYWSTTAREFPAAASRQSSGGHEGSCYRSPRRLRHRVPFGPAGSIPDDGVAPNGSHCQSSLQGNSGLHMIRVRTGTRLRSTAMKSGGTHAPQPLGRQNRKNGVCGLCGFRGRLSKTHVPPRCAGNRGSVRRFQVVSDSNRKMGSSARMIGGIHFYGLCQSCNGALASWDSAYGGMARTLWGLATDPRIHLPSARVATEAVLVQPGAVARSVLAGCFALNPLLRELHATTATQLRTGASRVELESGIGLHLAVTRGPQAMVTGGVSGFNPMRSPRPTLFSWAQIYFPPLAWQMAATSESTPLAEQGWADVSDWLAHPPQDTVRLQDLVAHLPLVAHPRQDSSIGDEWVELLNDQACFVVVSDNATREEWID